MCLFVTLLQLFAALHGDSDSVHHFVLASLRRHYPVQVVRVGNRFHTFPSQLSSPSDYSVLFQ
jgi:hypothetical protein